MIKFGPYIERKYAQEIESKHYMTGRPCKNGHIDRKRTDSNKCESCIVRTDARREYDAKWKRNKRKDPAFVEVEKARRAAWLGKDGVKEALYKRNTRRDKVRRDTDPEYKKRSYVARSEYQKNNREKTREKSRRWVANNPDKVRMANHYRREHREITEGRNKNINLDELFRKSFGFCKYCTAPLFDGYHLDHIVPISLGGGNTMDNLQCICARCNLRKGAKHPDVWHEEIGWLSGQTKG